MHASVVEATLAAMNEHGWSREHGEAAGREYLRFLELARVHPGATLVPSKDVDRVWHHHLLHPAYDRACGGTGPGHDDRPDPDRARRFTVTRRLYRDRFGPPGPGWDTAADCQIDRPKPAPEPAPPPPPRVS